MPRMNALSCDIVMSALLSGHTNQLGGHTCRTVYLRLRAEANTTAQTPSVAPVGGCGFRDPLPQGSLRFALGFIPSPLRGWNRLALRG